MKQTEDLIKPKINEDFRELLSESYRYLEKRQEYCQEQYGLGRYKRWNYDQQTGLFEFSDSGIIKLQIKFEEVGSISKISNTWLWSWANPSVLENVKGMIKEVREFGIHKNFELLTKRKWYADELDGWEMTAISAYILQAKGAYRTPCDNLYSYFLFMNIDDLRAT